MSQIVTAVYMAILKRKNIRRMRSGDQMELPRLKSTFGRNAYSYKGPTHWNNIPSEKNVSLNIFKSEYLKLLLRDVNHPE